MTDAIDVEYQAMCEASDAGQPGWGRMGSAMEHRRYALQNKRLRRRCHCGCGKVANWLGCANGVALMSACEARVRLWVSDPTALLSALRSEDTA